MANTTEQALKTNLDWSAELQKRLIAQGKELGGDEENLMAEAACCLASISQSLTAASAEAATPVAWIPLESVAYSAKRKNGAFNWPIFTLENSTEEDRRQYHENSYDLTPVFAAPQASQPIGLSLAALDAAFEAEIQRVSSIEYNSNEICRHFYGKLRERLASNSQPVSGALTDELKSALQAALGQINAPHLSQSSASCATRPTLKLKTHGSAAKVRWPPIGEQFPPTPAIWRTHFRRAQTINAQHREQTIMANTNEALNKIKAALNHIEKVEGDLGWTDDSQAAIAALKEVVAALTAASAEAATPVGYAAMADTDCFAYVNPDKQVIQDWIDERRSVDGVSYFLAPLYTTSIPTIPNGWKLIPIEMTREMVNAHAPYGSDDIRRIKHDWSVSLQNAPNPPFVAAPQASQPIGQPVNKADYERGFDDGFILGAEKGRSNSQPVSGAMTDEQIDALIASHGTGGWQTIEDMRKFARSILSASGQAVSEKAVRDDRCPECGLIDWRDFWTGTKKTHDVCASCGHRRALASTPAQQTVAERSDATTEAPVNVPSGYKLVPMEPTPEMIAAANELFRTERNAFERDYVHGDTFMGPSGDAYYAAMLDAAPAPVQTEAQQSEKDALRESADEWSTPPVRTWLGEDAIAKEKAKS